MARKRSVRPEPASVTAGRPGAVALGAAVALAALHALWSLFQWQQLLVARGGGEAFCALGGQACTQVWDLPLASAVQAWSGLPVAGWGLVWSVVALALPLLALVQRARGRPDQALRNATLLTALAGVGAVVLLAAASLASGALCTSCAGTYALVLAYAASCLAGGRLHAATLGRGAAIAAAATASAFLALLYPGLRTPPARPPALEAPLPERATPETSKGQALAHALETLAPELQQALADALALYEASPAVPSRPPRALLGPAEAPVRITEFTDVLCGHCANLERSMRELEQVVPAGSFALEPRQFPLDAACNDVVDLEAEQPVRCLAARARICLEGSPGAADFAAALFEHQDDLSEARIYELAAPYLARDALQRCVAADATQAKLQEDIAWAAAHGIRGTPLVLVNGRQAPAYPLLLYALIMAEGDPNHPAFAALPAPEPRAVLR